MKGPTIDYMGLAPTFATIGGAILVLILGLFKPRWVQRTLIPLATLAALGTAIGFSIANWEPGDIKPIIEGALAIDTLALGMAILFYVAGAFTVLLSLRSDAMAETGAGEWYCLLLGSISGMVLLASAENLVTLFVGLELLSIPLYVLCASRFGDERSLEAGLKYLVIGSVGSATLLYGLALIYGATGHTDFSGIAGAIGDDVGVTDPLLLTGIALSIAGLAFKASVAPFHQWTPDVYQGAPTPVTAFMAVATKAAAFAIILRLFGDALIGAQVEWSRAFAVVAVITIIIGNVGAIAQSSLKRMLAWSGVGQAGYMLAGVVVGTTLGLQATAFYLACYLVMNIGAFAVVIARERASELGDDIRALEDLGAASPWLAWPMTICMLSLAGFPATAGFIGKFYLIDASVAGDFTVLGIAIVIGSMLSLAYYLRVVAVMWMGRFEISLPSVPRRTVKTVGGWSPEGEAKAQPELAFTAIACAVLTVALGIIPSPLFDLARDVGTSLPGLG